jgi:hypothetical protein
MQYFPAYSNIFGLGQTTTFEENNLQSGRLQPYSQTLDSNLLCRLLANRSIWKGLPGTNTPAYLGAALVKNQKESFMAKTPLYNFEILFCITYDVTQ